MSGIPSVLVVDDGQLDRVYEILEQLGAEPERIAASKVRGGIEKPRDLVVMSWHPTKEIPELLDNAEGVEPTKVCFHSQDFLPLRQRLRDLGVDFLVQGALDNDSLRAFLQSQLHDGPERRADLRLNLGGTVGLQIGDAKERAKLADLSTAVCRVVTDRQIPVGEAVTIVFPKGLGGDAALEVPGRVIRSGDAELRPTRTSYSIVVRFEGHADAVCEQLEKILAGEQIGTRATPLQPAAAAAPAQTGPSERRSGERHPYERPVALLDLGGAEPVIGRDLSMSGVRLTGAPDLAEGAKLTIALYGASKRGEPVVVDAAVIRVEGDAVALEFTDASDAQRRDLERLLGSSTMVESLKEDGAASRRIVGRVLPRNAA